jgi:peptidyl-prolyl cis-trans isomerase D
MLQFIRERSQGWFAWVVVSLVCLTFALWGIHSYLSTATTNDVVATVNGETIHQHDVEPFYERLRQQQQLQLGADYQFDQTVENQLKKQALNQLIITKLLSKAAYAEGYRVTKGQVDNALLQIPAFQIDGQFSRARFEEVMRSILYHEADFLADMRTTMLINQVRGGFVDTEFALPDDVAQTVKFIKQRRDISYLILATQKFLPKVQISEQAAHDYYTQHQAEFKAPEQMSIEYLEVAIPELIGQQHFTDDQLEQFYKDNLVDYTKPERWQIAQIVLKIPQDASTEQETAVKAQLEALAKRVQAGEDFSRLAQQYSDDKLSAEQGGVLDWFSRGSRDPLFEKGVSSLTQVGQISEPVRTKEGYCLIKLFGIKKAEVIPFAESKTQVANALAKHKAEELFTQMTDKLANLTYANPDSLNAAAQALHLTVKSTELFSRQGGKDKITSNPRVVAVAFSSNVIDQGNNSDVIQIDPNTAIVLRLKQHKPEALLPFAEVKSIIIERLRNEAAKQQAVAAGSAILQRLKRGENGNALASQYQLNWQTVNQASRFDNRLDSSVLEQAFHMPRPQQGAFSLQGIVLPSGDFAVITVNCVYDGNYNQLTSMQKRIFQEQIEDNFGQFNYNLYAHGLLSRAKVVMRESGK